MFLTSSLESVRTGLTSGVAAGVAGATAVGVAGAWKPGVAGATAGVGGGALLVLLLLDDVVLLFLLEFSCWDLLIGTKYMSYNHTNAEYHAIIKLNVSQNLYWEVYQDELKSYIQKILIIYKSERCNYLQLGKQGRQLYFSYCFEF